MTQTSPKQKHRSRAGKKSSTQKTTIRKSSTEKRERQQALDTLAKMLGSESCSQLEIMQNAIDRIWRLRDELCYPICCDTSSASAHQQQSPIQMTDKENIEDSMLHQLNRQLTNMLKS
ncbi:hypothetical protein M3Y97_00703200 [Aphelenchoides bicaudatus]|nr:hypothetical protein M3Y97_00703200 [Aphelenchoides bicaudatus]